MGICMTAKKYPDSLHCYKIIYTDNSERDLYGNGMTHVYTISKANWPSKEIYEVKQLDDSWKNSM